MDHYVSIFDPVPWDAVGISVFQTWVLYWVVLLGIKVAGRRVFGELGPQDFIILLLVAEACDLGLTNEEAGFWGTLFSALTILVTGGLIDRIPFLRGMLEENAIELLKNGKPDFKRMKRSLVREDDLKSAARTYGMPDYTMFERMILESDGSITGVLKPEFRKPARKITANQPE